MRHSHFITTFSVRLLVKKKSKPALKACLRRNPAPWGASSVKSQDQLHLSHKTDTFTRTEWMISLKGTLIPQVLEKTMEYFGTLPNEKVKIGSGRKSHFLALAT